MSTTTAAARNGRRQPNPTEKDPTKMNTNNHDPEVITLPTRYVLHGEFADYIADIAKCGEIYYPLTMCCKVSATGSMGQTCCRECYKIVDTVFGCYWTETEWQEKHAQQ